MDVTVVGSCNIDLISYVPRLPKPGETIQGSKFSMGFGGKGANQCIASSRLGAKTAMISKVGTDTFGDNYIQNFKDNGINTDHIGTTSEAMTGTAPICVDDSGQNSIVIVPGANLLINEEDLTRGELVIAGSKVVVCQLEIEPKITLSALKMARKHGVKTIFNPAPAIPLDREFYTYTDVFCPNESEAQLLAGKPVTSVEEARVVAKVFLGRGCGGVVVTLGEMGVLVAESETSEMLHVPCPTVVAVDTTGAGDSFIGALAFYLSTRPDLGLQESARRAVQVASTSVQRHGTQSSYPKREDLPSELFS